MKIFKYLNLPALLFMLICMINCTEKIQDPLNQDILNVELNQVTLYESLNEDLVAYYPFDGNANDNSGNNHHGIVHGATLTTDRFGNENSAYMFNGVDTYIDLTNTDTLNMLSGFTLAAWVNFTTSNGSSIVSKHVNYYHNGFTMSACNDNANLTTDNNYYYIATTEKYNDGAWHLFTGVYDGTTLSIYVDGVLKVSDSASYTTGNDMNIRIGADSELSFFNGKIDDVRIWDRALSKNEILSLYPQYSSDKDLVAYYPFNGNANDKSIYGNNGTVHGATPTEDRYGNENCAFSFDGIDDYIEVPDNPSLRITDEITVMLWTSMEYGEGGDDPRLVSKGGDYDGFELCTDGPQGYGTISVRLAPPSLVVKDLLTAGEWDHITAVVDQEFIKLYLNGQLKGSIKRDGPILESSQPLCIGQKSIWGWDKYKGKIDDVRIWKRALSEKEILSLFKE
jgi:Concanavalin A-like lectin/glucanases superfamily